MLFKLEAIKNRFDEVSELIVDPNIISDMKQYIQLNKEYKDLQPIIEAFQEYKNILSNIKNAKEMLKDDEMKEMAKIELDELTPKQEKLEEEIRQEKPEDSSLGGTKDASTSETRSQKELLDTLEPSDDEAASA